MTGTFEYMVQTCERDKEQLIRVTELGEFDLAVCPVCFASGDYGAVVRESDGLDNGRIFSEGDKRNLREIRARRP